MLSFIKYCFKFSLFIFLTIQNILFAAELTGTVSDTTGASLKDVKVKLECLTGGTFLDSIYTDSIGKYSFAGYPIGSYKIYLSKNSYIDKDSSLLLGSDNVIADFVLHLGPIGTIHSGEENGIWLASGNPHKIVGNVSITDSLYIAPGCSVIFDKGSVEIIFNGILRIGSNNNFKTHIENGLIYCIDTSVSILEIQNAYISGGFNIRCKKIKIDSVYFESSQEDGEEVYLHANDSLYISNSFFQGYDAGNYFYITAKHLILYENKFKKALFSVDVTLSTLIEYCLIEFLELSRRRPTYRKVNHCNIEQLFQSITSDQDPLEQPDSIVSCIISKWRCSGNNDTVYASPFSYNIIESMGTSTM